MTNNTTLEDDSPETTTRRERFKEVFTGPRSPFRWGFHDDDSGFWFVFALSWIIIPLVAVTGPFKDHGNDHLSGYTMAVWHMIIWVCIGAIVWYALPV